MSYSRAMTWLALAGLIVFGVACNKGSAEPAHSESSHAEPAATQVAQSESHDDHGGHMMGGHEMGEHMGGHMMGEHETGEHAGSGMAAQVDVSAEGTQFDPPVTVSQIPAGAWMCDMGGSVHYAAMEPGDGSCPVCGMNLTQQAAGEGGGSGHEGHEH